MRQLKAAYAFLDLGLQRALAERLTIFGRILTLFMLIGIFNAVFRITPFEELPFSGLNVENMTWYLGITELSIFAAAHLFREVQNDIIGVRMAGFMLLPISYPAQKIAEWFGGYIIQIIWLGIPAFIFIFLLTGEIPFVMVDIPFLFVGLLLAGLVALPAHFIIGSASLWLRASEPIYWIWQKGNFVLGGLFIPLTIFPEILKNIAINSPFAAMLYIPAATVFDIDNSIMLGYLMRQVFWVIIMFFAASLIYRATLNHIGKNGD